ncbi:hypothetical protein FQR65_LT08387 [Abscondita terminalis]|nr:hypothetical protein FQR65_LT08387 [Abscondita terminalis]
MGKKNKSDLGRSLIKDRFGGKAKKFVGNKSMLHTTEIQDGYDWGRLNLQSVTEESSFQEFLATAELAGTEFEAEKLNYDFINSNLKVGLLSQAEKQNIDGLRELHKDLITIPRRPQWTKTMTVDELQSNEREHFLEWRRSLATLQEKQDILLTPFEKNLEFWRQLWRVIERSDVVVQIVDARNPLLFRCEDLEKYVKEVSINKLNIIVLNKADFLTNNQRQYWADYFAAKYVQVVFYSALLSTSEAEEENLINDTDKIQIDINKDDLKCSIYKLEEAVEDSANHLNQLQSKIDQFTCDGLLDVVKNSNEILSREKLIKFFKTIHTNNKVTPNITTIGLVGYPNVGKSSTINSLLTIKKVSVSATPGKTKHFQTLFLDKDLLLCDCPGLVMPSFVYTKAEMIINGILPIDQMRDHVPPISLICSLIPRHILEDKYGLMLPLPIEGEDPNRPPFAEELLNAYGYNRGFMTANGQPDNPRSARFILKDFVNGKLLYAYAPPEIDQSIYCTWSDSQKLNRVVPPREALAIKSLKTTPEDVDRSFFRIQSYGAHVKGKQCTTHARNQSNNSINGDDKPWKKENKHKNKKKREKLRRLYVHLDKH